MKNKQRLSDDRSIKYRRYLWTSAELSSRDRKELKIWRRNSLVVLLAMGFLFIYIVFDIDDPIEIFDYLVGSIKLYSKSVVWVKDFWEVFCTDLGIFGWLIEKIFKVEVNFGIADVFDFFFGWIKKI